MSQSSSHCSSLQRFSCRMVASDRELMQRHMAVSSAKSLTLDLTCSGRSFTFAKKRMGPSMRIIRPLTRFTNSRLPESC